MNVWGPANPADPGLETCPPPTRYGLQCAERYWHEGRRCCKVYSLLPPTHAECAEVQANLGYPLELYGQPQGVHTTHYGTFVVTRWHCRAEPARSTQ